MKKIVLPLLIASLLYGCGDKPPEPAVAEPKVESDRIIFPVGSQIDAIRAVPIQLQPIPLTRLNGRLIWNEDKTVRIYTAFAGRVERILVKNGQMVGRGQPLALVTSPDFGQAHAEARRAASEYALAQKNLARIRELEQHGVAARKDLQIAEADVEKTKVEFDRARNRLAIYGTGNDGVDQTYTLISPIAGTIVERNINPGQELRPDQMTANAPPLFVVSDPSTLWAQFDATERDLPILRTDKLITVHTPAYRDEEFKAHIDAVSDFLDPTTRSIKVRATLDNTTRRLKGEMFVTADIDADGERELLVPTKAVYFQNEKNYVFIEDGAGTYVRRQVRTGDVRQNKVEILSGLNENDKVVIEGSLMLQQVMQPRRIQK